jgi:hypothetical protein
MGINCLKVLIIIELMLNVFESRYLMENLTSPTAVPTRIFVLPDSSTRMEDSSTQSCTGTMASQGKLTKPVTRKNGFDKLALSNINQPV